MKATLKADVTITKITIFTDARIGCSDERTHLVEVEGYVSHNYLWKDEDKQSFKFDLHAEADLCNAIKNLVEKDLLRDTENFPKPL